MDYQLRMRQITEHLNDFLRRYRRPDHLDAEQSLIELRSMAEAVNKRIAASVDGPELGDRVRDIFQCLAETYRGKDWPKVADFVAAVKDTHKPVRSETSERRAPEYIMADRMNAGEGVGDGWLYGRLAVTLMATGLVSQETMRQYRSALYFSTKDVLGKHPAGVAETNRREAEWIARHEAAEAMQNAPVKNYDVPVYEPKHFGGAA